MTDFAAVRTGLADRIGALANLTAVYDHVPDRIVTPSAVVFPASVFAEFRQSMDGSRGALTQFSFDVVVFSGRFDTRASQQLLDSLVDDLPAIIEADQTLGGAATVTLVTEATDYGVVTVADTQYLGARFSVEVWTA